MERKLRWGLLSTARINNAIIPPLQASGRNELFAVASRSLDKAKAYADEWRIPNAYGSYDAMLADPKIDVIYNSLPNSLHAEWTVRAAQAGKHVLCEKPLAISLAEVDAITGAAGKAGVVVAEAFMYRHHPQTLKVKELVEAGSVGELRYIRGAFTYSMYDPNNVRLVASLSGGCLWDVGCYPVSYARYIAGAEPLEVFGWQVVGETGVDVSFAGQMRFPGEVIAQFVSSFRTPSQSYMEVTGSTASLYVGDPFKPGLEETLLLRSGEEVEALEIAGRDLYLGEIEDLADAVLYGKPPRISLADSRANIAALVALLESAQKNTVVRVKA